MVGGALSNVWDRIEFGYVVDFIDFRYFAVFNFADVFINLGAIGLFISEFCGRSRKN